MIPPDCAAARDLAPDLAVGVLDGAERARVLEHVHGCPSCQAYLNELTGIADELVHLAPELEPPPGFSRRVVATMERPRRLRRRWIAGLAAAAAAAAIVSVVTVRVIDAERTVEQAIAPTLDRAPMVGADGLRVGEVLTASGDATAFAIQVDYAVPDGSYGVVLRSEGAAHELGTITITEGAGEWSGRAPAGEHPNASLALVDAAGLRVCSADVGDV